jgi:sulfoxide reductase heme-binding subunit YedZ
MSEVAARRLRVGIPVAILGWVLIILYTAFRSSGPFAWRMVRSAALLGYSTLFLTILSNEYLREMKKLFGRPFMAVHHILAVSGLALIVVHPAGVVLLTRDASNLVPRFESLRLLLMFGGRPALYLILLAAATAVARRRLVRSWRYVHWLNYAAFALAFAHAWLLGTDASHGLLAVAWPAMFVLVAIVFVRKRFARPHAKRT